MLVGICGNAGSGKDTIADHLIKKHGFVRVAFADPLKRICKDVFDFSDEQLWGASEKRNEADSRYPERPGMKTTGYLTPRYALQTLGTEWGRNCYPHVWVEYAIRTAEKLQSGEFIYSAKSGLMPVMPDSMLRKNVVISDVRFKNEVDKLKAAGGYVVRVIRPGHEGKVGIAGHASEEEQKSIPDESFNAVIYNQSTLEDLYDTADRILLSFV